MNNNIYIKAVDISKRFFIFNEKGTTLRMLKSFVKRQPFKKEFWVLRNISFTVEKGQKIAVVGKNGSGKTTILRILSGIYNKTSGRLEIKKEPKILFRFWIGLNYELPVVDNIYLFGAVHGMSRDFLKQNMDKILDMAELQHLRFSALKDISIGQKQRLALSVFFQTNSDFLIFDESLIFIDQVFACKCETYFKDLSSSDKTIIMTSHDSNFLRKYCKTALWIDEGRIRMSGGIEEVLNSYEDSFLQNK